MTITPTPTFANLAEPLGDDEIHVWSLDYRRDQRRAPLLALLARYLGIDAAGVHLIEGKHGRPALGPTHDPTLDFNWSHSADRAVVAVARQLSLGIDLERRRERPSALAIAQRYFHADEVAGLTALPVTARSAAFLELWTAKEAVLKATGRGIAFGLHRIALRGEGDQIRLQAIDGDSVRAWQLRRLTIDPDHVAALAWRGSQRKILQRTLASDG